MIYECFFTMCPIKRLTCYKIRGYFVSIKVQFARVITLNYIFSHYLYRYSIAATERRYHEVFGRLQLCWVLYTTHSKWIVCGVFTGRQFIHGRYDDHEYSNARSFR